MMVKKEETAMNDLVEFGRRVHAIRIERGLTLQELADKCGYTSRSTVGKLEKGKIDVSQTKIQAIAEALGVSPLDLMGYRQTFTVDAPIPPATAERLLAYAKRLSELQDGDRERVLDAFDGILAAFEK